ncbi:von Willebrand factor D and EGF domain-containing protein-like [Elysia marginata]|uniref:von Willebrand factor D and EGF domain-containing protein-like n=1 Tax=Elysia marginata TaxID=1093978 RepID=A0AAV4HBZ8_9GAST|nr:von Willebrand factor D and EGF domain-containing protein-like [Elysia marginata]
MSIIGWSPPAASTYYRVSASSDQLLFGNELSLHVFDGTCLDCDGWACSIKPQTCQIDNVCYKHGAVSPHNQAEFCDSGASSTSWTFKPTTTPQPTQTMWVSISGPDANGNIHCDIHDLDNKVNGSDVTYQWLINGQLRLEEQLKSGTTTAETHISDLISGGGGMVRGLQFSI